MVRAYRVPDLRGSALLVFPAHIRAGSIKDLTNGRRGGHQPTEMGAAAKLDRLVGNLSKRKGQSHRGPEKD